ncbi:MAG: ABC transporter permease [Gemmatimonadota bacterium]|nr:MAG: ABC transporter permease [Gemmatimonadota bacterium]
MLAESIPGRLRPLTILQLGWRNLRRNRRRTWITATTVALAVLLVQVAVSLLIGIEQQSFDNLINYQTAHAKLYAEGYFANRDELPLDYTLTGLDELQATIRGVRGVAATTPRLSFSAQVSNGVDLYACIGVGIQVTGSDHDVFRIPQAVVDGEYLKSGEDGLLMGTGLAELFGVDTGDWVTVLTKTQAGAYEALDLPIVGLVGTGNPLIDRNSFLVPLEIAQYMLGLEGAATELAIRFSPTARDDETIAEITRAVQDLRQLDVKGWREMEEDFMALVRVKRTGQGVFLLIFIVLAVVGITNTILMASFERTREIGMMMAMGLRGSGIRELFLTEGALTGLLGGALGSLVAVAITAYFATVGLDLTAMYGDMDIGYPVKDTIYPAVNIAVLVASWLLTGVLAALASFYPAARASRHIPVEALRHV